MLSFLSRGVSLRGTEQQQLELLLVDLCVFIFVKFVFALFFSNFVK